jgi:hypothetical protein
MGKPYTSTAQVLTPNGWATAGGGGVSDGDKGDITVSASGATWTIDNDAVTYAKMQNVSATDMVLGRSSGGAGDVQEIACTAAGRALLDDADAAAQRVTLALQFATTNRSTLRSPLPASTTQLGASGTAMWCYVGYLPAGLVIKRVGVGKGTAGAGAQTAEVCVATGTGPPAFANQTLTKVWANGTLEALTGANAIVRNTVDNAVALPADAHVWLGFRQAMATTQATLNVLQKDFGEGCLMTTAASGALTGAGPWVGVPVAFNGVGPDIRGYL